MNERSLNLITIVVLAIAILGGLIMTQFPLYISSDSTKYLLGARFISQGKGYIEFADGDTVIYNRRWPPAYSFFIALGIKLGLDEIQSARTVNFIAWCVMFITWIALFRKIFSPPWEVVASFLMLLSWGLWAKVSMALSEILFVALLGLVGWSLTIVMSPDQPVSIRIRWLLLGSFALMGVGLTRYAGLPIIIATGLAVLFSAEMSRQERLKVFLILMAIALGGNFLWMIRNKFLTGEATLIAPQFLIKATFQVSNLSHIPDLWYRLWREAVGTPYSVASHVGWVSLFVLGVSLVISGHKYLQPQKLNFAFNWIIFSTIFYLGMLLILRTFESRYLWILQPFTVSILVKIVSFLYNQLHRKTLFMVLWCCYTTFVIITFLVAITRFSRCVAFIEQVVYREPLFNNATFEPFSKSPWIFQWIKLNCKNSDLILSNFADFIYFATNYPSLELSGNISQIKDIITKAILHDQRDIYLILYKDNLWRKSYLLPWQEYYRIFSHQIIYEDNNIIIAKLKRQKYIFK